MPKEGYSAITVPSNLYEKIRSNAEHNNNSIPDYLKMIFEMSIADYLRLARVPAEDRSVAGSSPASGTTLKKRFISSFRS